MAVLCQSSWAVPCRARALQMDEEGPCEQCRAVPKLWRWTRRGPVSSAMLCQNSGAMQGEILCVAVLHRGSWTMPCSTKAPEPDKERLNGQCRAKAYRQPWGGTGGTSHFPNQLCCFLRFLRSTFFPRGRCLSVLLCPFQKAPLPIAGSTAHCSWVVHWGGTVAQSFGCLPALKDVSQGSSVPPVPSSTNNSWEGMSCHTRHQEGAERWTWGGKRCVAAPAHR